MENNEIKDNVFSIPKLSSIKTLNQKDPACYGWKVERVREDINRK